MIVSPKQKYTRAPARIHDNLMEKDNRLITKQGCKIQFPKDYVSGKLGEMGNNIMVIGVFAVIVEDVYYGVSVIDAKVTLTPDSVNVVTYDDIAYMELVFEPGSIVMDNTNLIKDGPFVFFIYDEYIAKGKTPWYMDYTDLGILFDTVQYHAGVDLKQPHAIYEMLSASRARDNKDRAKLYRYTLRKQPDYVKSEPVFIPLRSVAYGADNTTARLLGSYLQEGISASLVNPTDKLEKIEELLLT